MKTPKLHISQAAAALGLDPYNRPLDVYEKVTGKRPPEPDTVYTKRGRQLEPLILNILAEEHGFNITQTQVLLENEYLRGYADAYAQDAEGRECVVECKTTQNFAAPPHSWQLQGILYAHLAQRPRTYIAVLRRGLWLELFAYDYDAALLQDALEALQEFYRRYIEPDIPPGSEWDEYLLQRFPYFFTRDTEALPRDIELADIAAEYSEISERIRQLEKRREELRNALLASMEQDELQAGNYVLCRRVMERKSLDWKLVPEELLLQLQPYVKVTQSVTLTVKPAK